MTCDHVTISASDHKAVVMELYYQTFQRGRGYWKFNHSLLENHSFIKLMNERLERGVIVTALIRIHGNYVKLKYKLFAQSLGKTSQTKKEMTFFSVIYRLPRQKGNSLLI